MSATDSAVDPQSPMRELPVEPQPNSVLSRIMFWGAVAFILGYCATLLGAFGVQLGLGEFPCPLCMVQRYAMILATLPAMWIVIEDLRGTLTRGRYVRSLGLSIIASVCGAVESTRQILLHIKPGDPGYGGAVLGMHLYTWALFTFVIVILYCGIAMTVNRYAVPLAPTAPWLRGVAWGVCWLFIAIIAANVVAIILLEGFALVLPDDPTYYNLLHQLGIGA